MTKDLANRYIAPVEIRTLDDIPDGYIKKPVYIVKTAADIPHLEENALCFIVETQEFKLCTDESTQQLQSLNVTFYIKEYLTLNTYDIANKSKKLKAIPMPGSYTVIIVGGSIQVPGKDYNIVNDNIVWNGLGLDGELEVDDIIYIEYLPM